MQAMNIVFHTASQAILGRTVGRAMDAFFASMDDGATEEQGKGILSPSGVLAHLTAAGMAMFAVAKVYGAIPIRDPTAGTVFVAVFFLSQPFLLRRLMSGSDGLDLTQALRGEATSQ